MSIKKNSIVVAGLATLVAATYFGFGAANQQNTVNAESKGQAAATDIGLDSEPEKLGYMFGFQIASNMMADGIINEIDKEAFYAAQRDIFDGKEPRMTVDEMQATQQAFMTRKQEELAVVAAETKAKGDAYLAANKVKEGVKTTESGLQYEVLREGKGKTPTPEQTVSVHYQGALIDGSVFDSSYERNTPASFAVTGVIPGFSEGLQLMKEGAKYRFVIPGDLAYGPGGAGAAIGANEVLVFEVELIEIK